jgi:hypothetical protein
MTPNAPKPSLPNWEVTAGVRVMGSSNNHKFARGEGGKDWNCSLDENGLPKEVSTSEAAEILRVSKDSVLKLKAAGLLEYRNTASPDSSRPIYAFSLRSVLEIRTNYQRDIPIYRKPESPKRHGVKAKRKYKHFTLSDD